MSAGSPHNPLTERQQNLCSYSGVFGIMLTVTCLIQHFVVAIPGWITNSIVVFYLFISISFLVLALQKVIAPLLLIISAVLSLMIQYLWMKNYAISLAVLLLFLYTAVIIVALFTEHIPQKLKEKHKAEKAEEDLWSGKL